MRKRTEFQLRLAGTGGQGLGLAGRLLSDALVEHGMQVAQSQSYEPVSRGGTSRSDLVASTEAVDYPLVTDLDYLVALDQSALADCAELLNPGALVIIDGDRVPAPPAGDFTLRTLPLVESARRLGNPRVANVIGLGALVVLGGLCEFECLERVVRASTPGKFRDLNVEALRTGRHLVA